MDKKTKKQYEKDQFELLGGKAQKNEKMPYWLLMKRNQREKNREKQREQEVWMTTYKTYIDIKLWCRKKNQMW